MSEIKHKIRNSLSLSVAVSLVVGIAMHFGYGYARGIFAPVVVFVGETLTDPYSAWVRWQVLLLNFTYSGVCGLVVAIVSLAVMQYLLKPRTMLFPQVAGISYIIASY